MWEMGGNVFSALATTAALYSILNKDISQNQEKDKRSGHHTSAYQKRRFFGLVPVPVPGSHSQNARKI
jgi:hypothetical protein